MRGRVMGSNTKANGSSQTPPPDHGVTIIVVLAVLSVIFLLGFFVLFVALPYLLAGAH